MFTVTAPIREPAKTAAAIIQIVRLMLPSVAAGLEHAEVAHGNLVRVRIVMSPAKLAAKIVGFVHNPDQTSGALLEIAEALAEGAAEEACLDRLGIVIDQEGRRRV